MGNLLQYTDKSKTIDNKLNSLLAQINYDYSHGNIRTETEYYYRIKTMLSEFYNSLTKPTFKYRPAISTPMSDEYNSMITESYNDMEYIIKDCETLKDLVSQSFIDAELSRNTMANEITYLTKQILTLGESIAVNQQDGVVIFTESFTNIDKSGNINDDNACYVNATEGILTLKPTTKMSVPVDNIEIDNEISNGFPGNTHCVDTLNNEMHFIGQEGLRHKPNYMIDDSKDTWFEFELFSVSDEVRKQCNSYGFEFDEGVSWINNDDILRLKIILSIESHAECSWISITPYLSDIKGVKNCYLENCEIVTTDNNIHKISHRMTFDDVLIFPFPPHTVKQVILTFVQPSKYLTKVGHFYYVSADTSDMSIFQDYDYSDIFARIDGQKPSISYLGCKYNPATQWIEYADNNTKFPDNEYSKTKLFTLPNSTISKKSNQEIIDAYRYMIGIREIKLSSSEFKQYGEYVSKVFNTKENITSVTLETDEYIPGDKSNILQYYISLNGGNTWHLIAPLHRAYEGISKYYINNDVIENMLHNSGFAKKSQNLRVIGEPKSIQLKICMQRPNIANGLYSTPIVYQYKLKLTTGGETIEY